MPAKIWLYIGDEIACIIRKNTIIEPFRQTEMEIRHYLLGLSYSNSRVPKKRGR